MNDPYIAIGSFDRPNLFYGVKCLSRSMSFVDELVAEVSKYSSSTGSTIIYCTTVKDTEQVNVQLSYITWFLFLFHFLDQQGVLFYFSFSIFSKYYYQFVISLLNATHSTLVLIGSFYSKNKKNKKSKNFSLFLGESIVEKRQNLYSGELQT